MPAQLQSDGRRPGRPPDPEKRGAILQAAQSLMGESGFDFSMEDIARRAAVSRQTVYNIHPSKEALVAAVIKDMLDRLAAPIQAENDSSALPDTLTRFALDYITMLTDEQRVASLRAIVSPSSVSRGFGQTIYRLGPNALRDRLAAYLERSLPAAGLCPPNMSLAADLFLSMVAGTLQLRAMLGVSEPAELGSAQDRVALAVSMFLRGLAGTSSSGPA
jgi:TetR/AcrR family transcriptional regulator, mexJK operon transcriptional repressor